MFACDTRTMFRPLVVFNWLMCDLGLSGPTLSGQSNQNGTTGGNVIMIKSLLVS